MRNMFDGCSSLSSLPNISKWNTSNLEEDENMFNKCDKLIIIIIKINNKLYKKK